MSVPLLINTVPYLGRAACARCSQCIGFTCPIEAKNGSHNTVIARAAATGLLSVITGAQAERISVDSHGRVSGVQVVGERAGEIWRTQVDAAEVVLSAGATETARLLLNSAHEAEPDGIGNNTDQVGRHLQGHIYAGALGVFEEALNNHVGPGPEIATNDFRHHNEGVIGGGMIANEFVPTPLGTASYLAAAGLLGRHGLQAKQDLRRLLPRMQRVVGPIQEMTSADSRVRLDPTVKDRFGIPVVLLSGSHHVEDERAQALLSSKAADWLTASGAHQVVRTPVRSRSAGPSSGQHQAGTARMGTDPASSATDPEGRVWGHPNLRVVDGSTHVTNGGVNPVLTIFANSFRVMDSMLRLG
jgi:choline dehydrogenase-like flavoprotein